MSKPGEDDQKPESGKDQPPDCPSSEEVELEPAGDAIVTHHEQARPPSPAKSIHPRRPLPLVPEKPSDKDQ
jgi:hypothetical protein